MVPPKSISGNRRRRPTSVYESNLKGKKNRKHCFFPLKFPTSFQQKHLRFLDLQVFEIWYSCLLSIALSVCKVQVPGVISLSDINVYFSEDFWNISSLELPGQQASREKVSVPDTFQNKKKDSLS